MFSALLTFLGGSVFRMIWGEVSAFLNKKLDHDHELSMMKAQDDIDSKNHQRSLENMRLQNELGVKTIEVQRESAIAQLDGEAFVAAQKGAFQATGIFLVDLWNGIIRPGYATVALGLWIMKLYVQGFKMDDFDIGLVAVVAGFFFADRSLRRNGK
jgi:hypothetical protein